jgi:hypothetical protein
VEVAAVAAAADTGAVAASAQVPWVASAEVMPVALAEVTWLASAEVARRAWAEITMGMDVVSATAMAITTTAAVRITRHTTGPTPAPTEWWADPEVACARLSKC